MNLPSFLWLWRIAAWSMGLAIVAYLLLLVTGVWIFNSRKAQQQKPNWLKPLHYLVGGALVNLVLLLLAIGLVGTVGHYGSLGHSSHLSAGLLVVGLVLLSAVSGIGISPERPWVRLLHNGINVVLFFGMIWVSLTGWDVVQKYLP